MGWTPPCTGRCGGKWGRRGVQGAEERPFDKEQRSAPLTRSFLLVTDISHSSLPSFLTLPSPLFLFSTRLWSQLSCYAGPRCRCGTRHAAPSRLRFCARGSQGVISVIMRDNLQARLERIERCSRVGGGSPAIGCPLPTQSTSPNVFATLTAPLGRPPIFCCTRVTPARAGLPPKWPMRV